MSQNPRIASHESAVGRPATTRAASLAEEYQQRPHPHPKRSRSWKPPETLLPTRNSCRIGAAPPNPPPPRLPWAARAQRGTNEVGTQPASAEHQLPTSSPTAGPWCGGSGRPLAGRPVTREPSWSPRDMGNAGEHQLLTSPPTGGPRCGGSGRRKFHESSGASAALLPLGVFVPRGSFEPQPLQRQGRSSTIKSKRAWPDLSSSRRRLANAVTRSPTSASDKVAKKSHSPAPTSRSADATVCAAVRCGCGGRPRDVLGSANDLAPSGNCDASAVDAAQDEGGAFAGERAPGCVGGGGEGAGMRRPPPKRARPPPEI